jgi:hypothetical protein
MMRRCAETRPRSVKLPARRVLIAALPALLLVLARHPALARSGSIAQLASGCGLTSPAFCDTFAAPYPTGNRAGQLNGLVWGVSRTSSDVNMGQGRIDAWAPSKQSAPGGCSATGSVLPDRDVNICNGQLIESVNDGGENVTVLAMYPKQPFDIAGRTGKVTFDVSDDTQGGHAAWPEFAYTDQPVPAPGDDHPGEAAYARNSFGFSLAQVCGGGTGCGNCSGGNAVTVDTAFTTTNYAYSQVQVTPLGCVAESSGPGQLNHFEVDLSSSGAMVYGTDAGTTGPLKPIAQINAAMPLTRGLIWLEDVHYNACKFNSQCDHTFTWANVGFDGPVLPRDLATDVIDNGSMNSDGSMNLGWTLPVGDGSQGSLSLQVNNIANPSTASAALLTLSFFPYSTVTLNYRVNGGTWHSQPWVFDGATFAWRTIGLSVPLSEVQAGTNTIELAASGQTAVANVDLILVGAGGVPTCLDPSACTTQSATPGTSSTDVHSSPAGPIAPAAYSSSAAIWPAIPLPGDTLMLNASVSSRLASEVLVDVELYDPAGQKLAQRYVDKQTFPAGGSRRYSAAWPLPGRLEAGVYTVKIGVFAPGWGGLLNWNDGAARVTIA